MKGDKELRNWKVHGRKRLWPYFKAGLQSQNCPGGTEENYEEPQSG
jgi:hypothetical protein